jgi:2-keto-3-deoxy-L-rhamnonate aldolase RhmA
MRFFWQQIASTTITEMLCSTKYIDGVVLDLEHGCFNNESIFQSIQIATLSNKKILVRVTEIDKPLIRMCLDAGCHGIILSTCETAEQIKEFVNYCIYPTKGGKRGQGLVRENKWGNKGFSFDEPYLCAQIETQLGANNIYHLLDRRINSYIIGPYDLSASCGVPGKFETDEFKRCVDKVEHFVGHKIGFHIVKNAEAEYIKNRDKYRNTSFVAFGIDTLFIMDSVNKINDMIFEGYK